MTNIQKRRKSGQGQALFTSMYIVLNIGSEHASFVTNYFHLVDVEAINSRPIIA